MFKFLKDDRGFTNLILGVVGLVIAIILYTSVVLPVVIGTNTGNTMNCYNAGPPVANNASCTAWFNSTNNNGWPITTIAMFGILPIALVGGLIAMVLGGKM